MTATTSPTAAPEPLRLSLLFVEDHAATAIVMARLLKRRGHSVSLAATCAEALAAAARERFDFVISDLGLPDGSGLELMRALREQYGLTGIALSGFGDADDVEQARASGFVRHFVKPIDIEHLQSALTELATAR